LLPCRPENAKRCWKFVHLDLTLSNRLVDLVDEGFDVAIRVAWLPAMAGFPRG